LISSPKPSLEADILKAVLFDLDNTLIHFDESEFFKAYLPEIADAFSDVMPFPLFYEKLMASSRALLESDGAVSNADFFLRRFSRGFEERRDELWKRFVNFYETRFDSLKRLVTVPEGLDALFDRLERRGLKRVIASNPLWPLSVQRIRLGWAGLQNRSFDYITGIENMRFCKPRIEYYVEICQKIGERPEDCLMAGNDPVNDMIVSQIGMKTYLVDVGNGPHGHFSMSSELRKGMTEAAREPDFRGTLQDLPRTLDTLMKERTDGTVIH
jgi:FMN phosphatase YigB (HAD superfamily)